MDLKRRTKHEMFINILLLLEERLHVYLAGFFRIRVIDTNTTYFLLAQHMILV